MADVKKFLEVEISDSLMRTIKREATRLEANQTIWEKEEYNALLQVCRAYAALKDNIREDLKAGLFGEPE